VARWQHTESEGYGPAVFDSESAAATLADAEVALRRGDAKLAKATYLRALGKLGPFSDPAWRSGDAADHRTRSQCHARLAAIAFDEADDQRSLRQTAAAAAARRDAIAADECTGDDVRFMITALVHAATVHARIGEQQEAIESCRVALEFSQFAEHTDHDPRTRRSIASAERAARRLLDALTGGQPGAGTGAAPTDAPDLIEQIDIAGTSADAVYEVTDVHPIDLIELDDRAAEPIDTQPPPLDLVDVGHQPDPEPVASQPLDLVEVGHQPEPYEPLHQESLDLGAVHQPAPVPPAPADFIDLTTAASTPTIEFVDLREFAPPAEVIDLTEPEPELPEVIDLTDGATDGRSDDNRFERRTDWLRTKAAERRLKQAQQAEQRRAERSDHQGERRMAERNHESPAILMARARGQAMLARFLLSQSPDEAVINAHRAVRTATRARQWAKHDHRATPQVALALIDTLVTRSDVLSAVGNPEVGRGDLRRSRAIGEQLWQVCPSVTTAAAAVLVAARSAAFEWQHGNDAGARSYYLQAQQVVLDAQTLGLSMPAELDAFSAPLDETSGIRPLILLGDRVLDQIQAGGFDTREVPHEAIAR
jgi:hypothetical protein